MFEPKVQDLAALAELYQQQEVSLVEQFAPAEWRVDPGADLTRSHAGHEDTADDVLAAAVDCQRQLNLAEARQLLVAARWADLHNVRHPHSRVDFQERLVFPGGDGTPGIAEFCPAELGAALAVSTAAAAALIADALDLRHRLPRLWARVQGGHVKPWVARQIARTARPLSADAAGRVDGKVADLAGSIPVARLMRIVDAQVLRADPDHAASSTEAAESQQGVWLSRDTDHGIGTLVGKAPAPDLRAIDLSVERLAHALKALGDESEHDVLRARALTLLANPHAALDVIAQAQQAQEAQEAQQGGDNDDDTHPGRPRPHRPVGGFGDAVVYLHLTDQSLTDDTEVARVENVGPVLIGQIRDWVGHRRVIVKPVIDLPGIRPADCYEVPDAMAEAIRLRTPASNFPYSPNLSRTGDNDHTIPYTPPDDGGPPGQTRPDNLARMTRREHRTKTHGRWRVTQPRNGAWIWTTPHGRHYLVDEHGTHPIGEWSPARLN